MLCSQQRNLTTHHRRAVNAPLYNALALMTHPDSLTHFLQQWLRDRNVTQLWLAQQAGIPHSTLSALFVRGIVPRPPTLRKLATAMGVPVGQLLVLAGHITEEEYQVPILESDLARLYEIGDLTKEEWQQVRDFARFVRSKRRTSS